MKSSAARGSWAMLAVSERSLEARQLDTHTVGVGEFDETAEPAPLLRLVVDENFGQAVIEKGIGESLDHGLEVSLRLVSHADRREHWHHFFRVERIQFRAHRFVRHRLADGETRRAAFFGPKLGEIGVAEIENEQF